mmetsp:Transcript_44276/g.76502  ORF Transcript_44276/g.76502 Transcript_44276/m.76502 type:complete len:300 (-) Transcript_44276:2085-2984(-)
MTFHMTGQGFLPLKVIQNQLWRSRQSLATQRPILRPVADSVMPSPPRKRCTQALQGWLCSSMALQPMRPMCMWPTLGTMLFVQYLPSVLMYVRMAGPVWGLINAAVHLGGLARTAPGRYAAQTVGRGKSVLAQIPVPASQATQGRTVTNHFAYRPAQTAAPARSQTPAAAPAAGRTPTAPHRSAPRPAGMVQTALPQTPALAPLTGKVMIAESQFALRLVRMEATAQHQTRAPAPRNGLGMTAHCPCVSKGSLSQTLPPILVPRGMKKPGASMCLVILRSGVKTQMALIVLSLKGIMTQ